jgi:coenzyme F420 hydrogenase subunit beta
LSKNRADLIAACGSRYSPASVGNGLFLVEQSARPCVIIGKPAEIAGIQNAAHLRPPLKEKILVTLSFFCAETPSTRGTLEMLQRVGSSPSSLSELRYRGHGWPGHFAPTAKGSEEPQSKTPYSESWGFLQSFRPWSVHLWPDSTGELADISCGDPWYKQPDGVNPGSSLIVARTEKGRNIIEGAISAGYLAASRAENWKLIDSQKGLLEKKGSIAGRRAALRSFGLPVTEFKGLNLFRCWLDIPMKEKIRSYFGTLRRIWTRRLRQRACLENSECTPVSPAGEVAFLR